MRPPTRLLFPLAVALTAGPCVVDCSAPEDEFLCEEAVAHMASCCPGLVTESLLCKNASDSCKGTFVPKTLGLEDSRCILALDCAAVQARSLCARVVDRAARARSDAGSDAGSEGRLCE